MNLRDQQYLMRKQQIKNTALNLFIESSLEATTTKRIATACNISSGLLFHYYDSKESLYYEIFEEAVAQIEDIFSTNTNATTPIAIIESITNKALEVLSMEEGARNFLFVYNTLLRENKDERINKICENTRLKINAIRPIITLGQQLNEIKPGNAKTLFYMYMSLLGGCAAYKVFNQMELPTADAILQILKA